MLPRYFVEQGLCTLSTMDPKVEPTRTVSTNDVAEEYNKVHENLKALQDQLRDKNDDIQRLKQAVLIATGAKVTLGKLLGLN